jgi:hypothetical protein
MILVKRLLEEVKTSGRIDDQDEDKIRNRYQEYNEKTALAAVTTREVLLRNWVYEYGRVSTVIDNSVEAISSCTLQVLACETIF